MTKQENYIGKPRFSTHKKSALEYVQKNVCSLIETKSKGEALFFLMLMVDLRRWTEVYPVPENWILFNVCRTFLTFAERQTGKQLKYLHSDGSEKNSDPTSQYFLKPCGIKLALTCLYMSQQNDTTDRRNLTLMDMRRAILNRNGNFKFFWQTLLSPPPQIETEPQPELSLRTKLSLKSGMF